jgi:hypothetical protein
MAHWRHGWPALVRARQQRRSSAGWLYIDPPLPVRVARCVCKKSRAARGEGLRAHAARLAIPDARRYAIMLLHALPDSLVLLAKRLEPLRSRESRSACGRAAGACQRRVPELSAVTYCRNRR